MKERNYRVYMVASKSRVLYIGMTNNLHRRVFEHKNDLIEGFTSICAVDLNPKESSRRERKPCHPERRRSYGSGRSSQSRDLLFAGSGNAAGKQQVPPLAS